MGGKERRERKSRRTGWGKKKNRTGAEGGDRKGRKDGEETKTEREEGWREEKWRRNRERRKRGVKKRMRRRDRKGRRERGEGKERR